jgi:hypothetical protein
MHSISNRGDSEDKGIESCIFKEASVLNQMVVKGEDGGDRVKSDHRVWWGE